MDAGGFAHLGVLPLSFAIFTTVWLFLCHALSPPTALVSRHIDLDLVAGVPGDH
jgi:hypothetical protein